MTKAWTPEQQREHRKLWVEALRSGKYQQGTEVLRRADGGMCCLGVACDISGLGSWGDVVSVDTGDGGIQAFTYVTNIETDDSVAPLLVRDWLGLSTANAGYEREGEKRRALSSDNDEGKTFAQIADIIESEPEGLIAEAFK